MERGRSNLLGVFCKESGGHSPTCFSAAQKMSRSCFVPRRGERSEAERGRSNLLCAFHYESVGHSPICFSVVQK